MAKKIIAPSMMCVDNFKLKETLDIFANSTVGLLHLDIMDGHFVPNLALGTDWCKQLKSATDIPLDYHLMVDEPEKVIDWLTVGEGDYITVHYESCNKLDSVIDKIKSKGAKVGVAIKPDTPVTKLVPYAGKLDLLLVMTVNPGFAGQKLIESTLDKIVNAKFLLETEGNTQCLVEVDGNVSFENARRMSAFGADVFVAGSSSVFAKNGRAMKDNIDYMQRVIDDPSC